MEAIDKRIRDAFSTQDKLDELDVQILEGLSVLGPRNLSKIAKNLGSIYNSAVSCTKDAFPFYFISPS